MTRLWLFTPWLPDDIELERFVEFCSLANREEMFRARPPVGRFVPDDFPTAQLEIFFEDFSADCFFAHSYTFVSQDLRDAMALGPGEVQYLPVDARLSAPLPRSKNYMIMHVPVVENVSDVAQSDYGLRNLPGGSKDLSGAWSIAIRPDADPQHELFRDSFFLGHLLCADTLAVRVLQRGCTGVLFFDTKCIGNEIKRFRTLLGIEEIDWNTVGDHLYRNILQPDL